MNVSFLPKTVRVILFLSTFAFAAPVLAWTGPSTAPPNGNAATPLDTSANTQTKSGSLILGSGSNTNWSVLNIGSNGTSINSAGPIYSYMSICAGNSLGTCAGTGGVVLNANGNITAAGKFTAGPVSGVSNGLISARANGDAIEWGHTNTAGYGGTLGAYNNNGNPYVAFDAQAGTTNVNTFKTNGVRGSILISDLSGGFVFDTVPLATGDNQAATWLASISNAGRITTLGDVCINGGKCLSSSNAGPVIFGGMFSNRSDSGVNIAANPWTGGGSCPSWAPTLRAANAYICCSTMAMTYYCTN